MSLPKSSETDFTVRGTARSLTEQREMLAATLPPCCNCISALLCWLYPKSKGSCANAGHASRAGTGLLSMMAARALATAGGEDTGDVSACESYLPMGKLMRRVLRVNGMENMVKVFHKRSDELKVGVELDSPADILVSFFL